MHVIWAFMGITYYVFLYIVLSGALAMSLGHSSDAKSFEIVHLLEVEIGTLNLLLCYERYSRPGGTKAIATYTLYLFCLHSAALPSIIHFIMLETRV